MRVSNSVIFDKTIAIELFNEIIYNMENIYEDKDKSCLVFYGGNQSLPKRFESDKIICLETPNNIEYIINIEKRIMKTFKNHQNWTNMRKSKRKVCSMLSWIYKTIYNEILNFKVIYLKEYPDYCIAMYFLPNECRNKFLISAEQHKREAFEKKLKIMEDELQLFKDANNSLLN